MIIMADPDLGASLQLTGQADFWHPTGQNSVIEQLAQMAPPDRRAIS